MIHLDDTIAAISTPAGQGGIGIVRMSGPQSLSIAEKIFQPKRKGRISDARSHSLVYGTMRDPADGNTIDEVLVSVMRSPNSYTKEDVVEINCHGGMISVKKMLEAVLSCGARLAEPGEFTRRAFLNGRINLAQAEAVLDLISAVTGESQRLAVEQLRGRLSERLAEIRTSLLESCALSEAYIDFPEEEIDAITMEQLAEKLEGIKSEAEKLSGTFQEARFFREGLSAAIVGRPNVGKSSLLNALLKKDRAIVTEFPGTTRDIIEEYLNIDGLPVRIIDTAGIRRSDEAVEKEGIRRSLDAIEQADFIIAVLDGSGPAKKEDSELLEKIEGKNAVIAVNKSDLPQEISLENLPSSGRQYIHISALTGEGIEELKAVLLRSNLKNWREEREGVVVTNIRHKAALDKSCSALERALEILREKGPLEIFSIELREALDSIGEITGTVATEDILNKIFNDFCIGK
jgi:tRNA modification GTPase